MSVSEIEIRNIKGFDNVKIKVQVKPNKPNLLVAPNGFGKSSIAIAFNSMNANRLKLEERDYHKEYTNLNPSLALTVDGASLVADDTKNDIKKHFDVTVIRSGLEAKAKKRTFGGFTQATASMEVQSIFICKIPEKKLFGYKVADIKAAFGTNSKVLPNISSIFINPLLLDVISNVDLPKLKQIRNMRALEGVIDSINQQAGTAEEICEWIANNSIDELRSIIPLNEIAQGLLQLGLAQSEVEGFLASYQIFGLFNNNSKEFKEACNWLNYSAVKVQYEVLLAHFCSSQWQWAKLKEDKKRKSLSVVFPKANHLSNGQRDLLTLVVKMNRALYEGSKKPLILIIDEVFDYLDDANLVAFQYYITSTIDAYKERGQIIYPIILTHLDPGVFFDFCFNKHKIQISYLMAKSIGKAKETLKLIEARDKEELLKDRLEKCWFHYHTETDEVLAGEWPNRLKDEWRTSDKFHEYTKGELTRYLKGKNYDPLAVCFAVRVGIEKLAYDLLEQEVQKNEFLDEVRNTKNKLNYVAERGVDIPETYFLLGLIYNTNLHWNQNRDYVSPLTTKLNHPTIRHLIADIFNI